MKVPVAEEQPAAALCLRRSSLLHECAERCDAGTRTNHNDVAVAGRQSKVLIGFELNAHAAATLKPFGHIVRRNALVRATMAFVAHGGNEQVRLFPDLTTRRSDGIGARREWPR